jgi:hypothetical protein
MSRRISLVVMGFVLGGIGLDVRAAVLPFEAELRFQTGATAPFGFDTTGFATVNGSSGGLRSRTART